MMNKNRTSRIAVRCSEEELRNLMAIAAEFNRTFADLVREAITIAYAKAPTERAWKRALLRAQEATPGSHLWTT